MLKMQKGRTMPLSSIIMNYMNHVNDSLTFNSKRRNLIALIALLDGRTDCCYSDKHLSSHKLLFQCYILLQSYIQH